jgi:hypothetical protein
MVTIFQPIAPWVQDVLAHTFNESEHIATVHHQNGKDHVHVEMQKMASKTNNSPINIKLYSDVPLHTPASFELVFDLPTIVKKSLFYYFLNKLPLAFMLANIPPPKF